MQSARERNYFTRLSQPDFMLCVAMGLVEGCSIVTKFAENPAIASAVPADIWDYPDEEIYTFSTGADIDSISSDDDTDTEEILILGLDVNYIKVVQIIALTGQTRKALDIPLMRVWRAYNSNGTLTSGNVYIYEDTTLSGGAPVDTTKVRAYFAAAEQNTLMGIYTIPAGKTGFFNGLTISISKKVAAIAEFTGRVRELGGVFRTISRFSVSSSGSSHVELAPTSHEPFPEKTDFVGRADVSTNDVGVSLTFDLLLVDNDLLALPGA